MVYRLGDEELDKEDDDVEGVPLIGRIAASYSGRKNGQATEKTNLQGGGHDNGNSDSEDVGAYSLVKNGEAHPPSSGLGESRGPVPPPPRRRALLGYVAAVALAAAVAMLVLLADDTRVKRRPIADFQRSSTKPAAEDPRLILRRMQMRFADAKARLFDRIADEYGRGVANDMFLKPNSNSTATAAATRGRLLFSGAGGSDDPSGWNGLKRKLTLKFLRALNGGQHEHGDGNNGNRIPVVWVTSGNSIAAGHGNLLNESYTAVLERAVGPLFDALSMNFVGRNYGISAASSGAHIALCLESKFGTDVDLLLWDFRHTGTFTDTDVLVLKGPQHVSCWTAIFTTDIPSSSRYRR
jgi:hypothetical protein